MSKLVKRLEERWNRLELKQQRTLRFALPVIAMLLLYLIFEPLVVRYQESRHNYQKIVSSFRWLANQQTTEISTSSYCGSLTLLNESMDIQQSLTQQLLDRQISNSQWQQVADGWQVELNEVNGNEVLNWLEQLSCQGLLITNVDIQTQSSGMIDAQLSLTVL